MKTASLNHLFFITLFFFYVTTAHTVPQDKSLLPKKVEATQADSASKPEKKKLNNKPVNKTSKETSHGATILPSALPSFRLNENVKPIKSKKVTHITQRVPVNAIRMGNNGLKISFNWMAQSKAAIFQRDNRLFVAFNRPALFDMSSLAGQSSFLKSFQSIETQAGSAVMLTIKEDVDISFKENTETHNWIITLSQESEIPSSPEALGASLVEQVSSSPSSPEPIQIIEGRIYFDQKEDESPLFFEDPVTNEDLTVVITDFPFKKERVFQELILLPTLKGLAFLHKSDDLTVLKKASFNIEKPLYVFTPTHAPLALSSNQDLTLERKKAPLPQLINHKKWDLFPTDISSLTRLNDKLVRDITENPKSAQKKRLERTFLLLAMGKGYEASGQLKLVVDKNPALKKEARFALLKGIAHVLSYQPDQAGKYLSSPLLKNEEEAVLWQGLVDLQNNKPYQGLKKVLPHLKRVTLYPKRMRQTPYFLLAEAAVQTNYPGKIFLDSLNKDLMTRREKNKFDLLSAQMEKSVNNRDFAKGLYRKVLNGQNVQAKIEAEMALLDPSAEKISENIAILENYRFRWRGDRTELLLLGKLASLYHQDKQPEKAVRLYQIIKDHFPGSPKGELEISRGQDLFYNTFIEKSKTPDFNTVALYDRFGDMTPPDDRQFTLLKRLSETYEVLNLPSHAARHLEHLLKKKDPTGDERGEILLHLARLYELDRKEKMLVSTLTRLDQIHFKDPDLAKKRLFTKARFEEEKKRPQKALELLVSENDFESLLLKARLAWKISDWVMASNMLSQLISHPKATPEQREDFLISLSVALFKQGQTDGLISLRDSFLSAFQTPSKKETFLLLTSQKPEIPETPTYRELLAQISAIENFEKSLEARKTLVK